MQASFDPCHRMRQHPTQANYNGYGRCVKLTQETSRDEIISSHLALPLSALPLFLRVENDFLNCSKQAVAQAMLANVN